MRKKNSTSKNDLDSYLVKLKADNLISTQRPYSSNLVHSVKSVGPQVGHKTRPIQITDNKRQNTNSNPNGSKIFFQDLIILFPCVSINLTKLRISILSKLIKDNGGSSITNGDYIENDVFTNVVQKGLGFVVAAKEISQPAIMQSLDKLGFQFQELQHVIIKSEWVTESVAAQELLDHRCYQLFPSQTTMKDENTQQIISQHSKIIEPSLPQEIADQVLELQSEFDINFLISQYEDDDERAKQMKKRKKAIKVIMKQNRKLLDYNYDSRLVNYHESYDEDDGEDHQFDFNILKKEEKQEFNPERNNFVGDDECYITDVKTVEKQRGGSSIFEGIDIPKHVLYLLQKQLKVYDIDDPLKSSQIRDISFNNPGFKKRAQYWEQKKDRFVCEAGSANVNYNDHIIKHLDRLLKCYTNDKDKGRVIAYRRAIAFIKSLKFEIKSEDDVKNMPTIGSKIKKKIVEILQTGSLEKADKLSASTKNVCQDLFTQVWGVGPQTAAMFYFKGLRTLDDLRKNQQLLNRNQKIGLKYVEEFKQRIPRNECDKIISVIQNQISQLSETPGLYEAIACGSYRRNKPDCGDIDILITRMDGKNPQGFLLKLVESLERTLLTDHLQLPSRHSSHGSESYMGVGQLQPDLPHRRIDMKLYPREQFGTAVLYFTGSDHFNRSMRLFAQKKGYTLSDHGLYPALRAIKNQKVWKGELIPCYTEEEVFRILNITYKTPEERSV